MYSNPQNLQEISDFFTNYTTYTVKVIDAEEKLYFSADYNDFYIIIDTDFKLYKRKFELTGDYTLVFESSSFNAVLNAIHFLTRINQPTI